MSDYYKVLGLSKGASIEEVKKAYKSLAKKYHPDVSSDPDAEKKFKEVIEECNNIIKDNPGIIKPFSYIGEAYYQLGDSAKARLAYTVYYNLLSLPFYSGNGTCYDSAFVVRSISDEYTIMHELGLNSIGQGLNYNNNIPFDILYTQNAEDNEEETGY